MPFNDIYAMFECVQPAILSFPAERPVFLREYASQMYGVVPYFLSKTVREVLTFAAKLRLNVESSQVKPLVEDMLASLGLQECADTMAGSDMIKGISGGQKKRACIAAELITNPAITFLDEPTSGLDTAAAYKVVTVLKELSRAQQSVLCTVHQPSS